MQAIYHYQWLKVEYNRLNIQYSLPLDPTTPSFHQPNGGWERTRRETAGTVQEGGVRWKRRFFERDHDKKKKKAREAARRNRKRFGLLSSLCPFLFFLLLKFYLHFSKKNKYLLFVVPVGSGETGKKKHGNKYSSFGFYVSSAR